MWTAPSSPLPDGLLCRVYHGGVPASFAEVVSALRQDAVFRDRLNTWIAQAPYAALRWECPPVTRASLPQPFQFVLLDSPWLDLPPDPRPFATHFASAQESVIRFPNLGGDAVMVVPTPRAPAAVYPHLAAFVRKAPADQRDALWRAVGVAMEARVGEQPVWLSTAGGGVAWLHVRLDDRPKYYGHGPYRQVG